MAKTKKIAQEDLKKFFEKMKMNLHQFGKETGVWMKKGERELSRLSKIGKLEFDVVNLNMKKEKLFKDIGKRVVESGLSEQINDSAIRNMSNKADAAMKESQKKKSEISKIGKRFLKSGSTRSKKKIAR